MVCGRPVLAPVVVSRISWTSLSLGWVTLPLLARNSSMTERSCFGIAARITAGFLEGGRGAGSRLARRADMIGA